MDEKLGEFLASFSAAITLAQQYSGHTDEQRMLTTALSGYLGQPGGELPVVAESFSAHRFADLDIALEKLAGSDPEATLVGMGGGQQRHHVDLADVFHEGYGYIPVSQPDYVNLPTGPDSYRQALALGIRLFRYQGSPMAVMQRAADPQSGRNTPSLSVLTADRAVAAAFLADIQAELSSNSILRGQVVSFTHNPYGQEAAGVSFLVRPQLAEKDVILPPGVLGKVSAHVLGIAGHRSELQRRGQHLKRGVLLYGPPGTGKTHTVRRLLSASEGTTAVLLSGGSLAAVSEAAKLARAMAPSLVILEDIDLVAEDRSFGHGPQPLLFEVLDALDGLDADADVAFIMTTNRVDVLERALAQRPGRVDLAVEIAMPDTGSRARLLALYSPDGMFSPQALERAAEQSEGATASFARELVRRAILSALTAEEEPGDTHLLLAVEELMGQGEELTRSLLGAAAGAEESGPGVGWLAGSDESMGA